MNNSIQRLRSAPTSRADTTATAPGKSPSKGGEAGGGLSRKSSGNSLSSKSPSHKSPSRRHGGHRKGSSRDKSPAAASRVNEKLLERLLEEKLQGPKNWLEGIKNGLVISKPSSEPSGPFVGPCKSCVSRGKPLQLGQSDDVLLLDVRSPATTSTTTRSTEPASVPVA